MHYILRQSIQYIRWAQIRSSSPTGAVDPVAIDSRGLARPDGLGTTDGPGPSGKPGYLRWWLAPLRSLIAVLVAWDALY